MNITLKDGYSEETSRNVNDILSSKTTENRDAITTLNGMRELNCIKFISSEQIFIIADGVRLMQYSIDESRFLNKIKEFNYNFEPDVTIRYLTYNKFLNLSEETKKDVDEFEYLICWTLDHQKLYGLNLQNMHDNVLITDMVNKISLVLDYDHSIIIVKLSIDNSCKIYVEKVFIPKDKEKIIHQIAFEGEIAQALDIANKLSDSSIASNVMLRKSWENSNRTLRDIEMSLRKLKDPEYIISQWICNTAPVKNILKDDAIDFINVQKELIKTGIETLLSQESSNEKQTIKLGEEYKTCIELIYQLLEKEFKLDQYQAVVNAFQDKSLNEIMDWETFSTLSYIEIIEYLNSVWIIEETPIDDILISLKEIDQESHEEHYIEILEKVDASLMTDKFLLNMLPQGNRPDKGNINI